MFIRVLIFIRVKIKVIYLYDKSSFSRAKKTREQKPAFTMQTRNIYVYLNNML